MLRCAVQDRMCVQSCQESGHNVLSRSGYFGVCGVDQGLEISIAKSIGLKLSRIAGTGGHVIRQDAAGKTRVPQDANDLEEIEHSVVGINFGKAIQSAMNCAHMNLVNSAAICEPLNERRNLFVGVGGTFCKNTNIHLESVMRIIDDHGIAFVGIEDRRGVKVFNALVPVGQARRIIWVVSHIYVVFLADGNYAMKECSDAIPILLVTYFAVFSYRKLFPVRLQLEVRVDGISPAGFSSIASNRNSRPMLADQSNANFVGLA